MLSRYLGLAVMVAALGGALGAYGQEATEMYIPIGQSPGLSGKGSLIGTLGAVDPKRKAVIVSSPAGPRAVEIAGRTSIWLDRSLQKQPNRSGAFADLRQGRKVEIKLRKGEAKAVAEWIKVEAAPD
jgi:hypothetical protein